MTTDQLQKQLTDHTCITIDELYKEFESLMRVSADLRPDEQAYWTLPRTRDEWRLPGDMKVKRSNDELVMLPVRDKYYTYNGYLSVIPQPIIMHKKVATVLEEYALRLFQHYPVENSLARREHGVPMLIGRFDVIVDKRGDIQICELDDVCSLWPALPKMNPIAESYLMALEAQLNMPIHTAELFQYSDGAFAASPQVRRKFARISFFDDAGVEQVAFIPRNKTLDLIILQQNGLVRRQSQKENDRSAQYYEELLRRTYLHNEDQWRGDITDAWLIDNKQYALDEVALSVRAYRDMPGFKEHLDRYGPRSITMAWERDSKWPLVPEKLAVLAANLDLAVEFGRLWQLEHPDGLLVFKTLYSARTEHTAIFGGRGTKLKGVSSAAQIARKFGDAANDPIIIQPFKEPDSLAQAGVRFVGTEQENQDPTVYTDRNLIRSVTHIGSPSPGARIISGMESHFPMIFRSFVVYLPQEKRLVHIGGMWQATDGRIVHGGAHSVAGPLYVDGLMGHPNTERSLELSEAEKLILRYSKM